MPTNLPPEYFHVEKLYKEARAPEEKAQYLEELLGTIPKHKGTDKLRADLRAKLGRLKSAALAAKKAGRHSSLFTIEKEGADARILVLGTTNTGKSSLVRSLTHAEPEVSQIPYTTWTPLPGIAVINEIHFQLIDTPPLDSEFLEPEFYELIKTADLLLVMLDLRADPIEQFELSVKILNEHRIFASHQIPPETDKRPFLKPMIFAANKDDDESAERDFSALIELLQTDWIVLPISVEKRLNIDALFAKIVSQLQLIRVYTKMPGKPPDKNRPFIIKTGGTVDDFTLRVHKDFHEKLKLARVWGTNVFDGQSVSKDHILHDGDIVELHI